MMDGVLLSKIRKFGKTPILTLTPQRIVGYSLGLWFGGQLCLWEQGRGAFRGKTSAQK